MYIVTVVIDSYLVVRKQIIFKEFNMGIPKDTKLNYCLLGPITRQSSGLSQVHAKKENGIWQG